MESNNRIGEVVFLNFPYTNYKKSKIRPAVIIAKSDFDDDYIVAYITTKIDSYGFSQNAISLNKQDLVSNDLKFDSLIRIDKTIVVNPSVFKKVVGKLKEVLKTWAMHQTTTYYNAIHKPKNAVIAMIFMRKHFMVEYIITGNPQREERYDYPLEAIREIVLNMIVHRDYRDSSDSIIKIFDDRIEFFNPGGLYDNLTIEALKENNYVSKTRNKLIALIFKECGLIEKYGSGIDRIKRLCKEHRLPDPKFEEIQKGFRVTVYKAFINEKDDEGINRLLSFIRTSPSLRVSQMSKALDIPQKTLERWIKQLKDENKVEYRGSKKTGAYYAL